MDVTKFTEYIGTQKIKCRKNELPLLILFRDLLNSALSCSDSVTFLLTSISWCSFSLGFLSHLYLSSSLTIFSSGVV